MEALFGASAGAGVRYALLVLFGLLGLGAVARGLLKLVQVIQMGPGVLGGGAVALVPLPFPTFFGVVVMLVELIGGILLLVGVVWGATKQGGRRSSSLDGSNR
jgi:uncharacterized membrane protein YphA (DoxX/SURF4 family)